MERFKLDGIVLFAPYTYNMRKHLQFPATPLLKLK